METPGIPQQQMSYDQYRAAQEEGNIKALAISSLVYGIFQFVMLGVQALFMGEWMNMMRSPSSPFGGNALRMPPEFINMIGAMITASYVVMGLNALMAIIAAKCIADRKGWIFVMISAGFNCINVPIGTILGVFLFIVMSKPTVKARFQREQPSFR